MNVLKYFENFQSKMFLKAATCTIVAKKNTKLAKLKNYPERSIREHRLFSFPILIL